MDEYLADFLNDPARARFRDERTAHKGAHLLDGPADDDDLGTDPDPGATSFLEVALPWG